MERSVANPVEGALLAGETRGDRRIDYVGPPVLSFDHSGTPTLYNDESFWAESGAPVARRFRIAGDLKTYPLVVDGDEHQKQS